MNETAWYLYLRQNVARGFTGVPLHNVFRMYERVLTVDGDKTGRWQNSWADIYIAAKQVLDEPK